MRVLISGFEPFLKIKTNPAQLVATQMKTDYDFLLNVVDDKTYEDHHYNILVMQQLFGHIILDTLVLPVEYGKAFSTLKEKIDSFNPDLVLSIGVAAEREHINLERVAINFKSTDVSDNSGLNPSDQKISLDGPDGVFSNLNVDEVVARTTKKTIEYYKLASQPEFKISVSNTAGTYVCNALMYDLFQDAKNKSYKAGFVHIPFKTDDTSILKFKNTILNFINYISILSFK